jgi:hypothetical protein
MQRFLAAACALLGGCPSIPAADIIGRCNLALTKLASGLRAASR